MGLSTEQKYTLATNIVSKLTGPQKVNLIKEILSNLTYEAFLDENLKYTSDLGILMDELETKHWQEWRASEDFLEYRKRGKAALASRTNTNSI